MELAMLCLDEYGQITQWPRPGGWSEQSQWEISLMRLARYVWRLFEKGKKWKSDDGKFLLWLDKPDDAVFSLYHYMEGQWPELTRADLVRHLEEITACGLTAVFINQTTECSGMVDGRCDTKQIVTTGI